LGPGWDPRRRTAAGMGATTPQFSGGGSPTSPGNPWPFERLPEFFPKKTPRRAQVAAWFRGSDLIISAGYGRKRVAVLIVPGEGGLMGARGRWREVGEWRARVAPPGRGGGPWGVSLAVRVGGPVAEWQGAEGVLYLGGAQAGQHERVRALGVCKDRHRCTGAGEFPLQCAQVGPHREW